MQVCVRACVHACVTLLCLCVCLSVCLCVCDPTCSPSHKSRDRRAWVCLSLCWCAVGSVPTRLSVLPRTPPGTGPWDRHRQWHWWLCLILVIGQSQQLTLVTLSHCLHSTGPWHRLDSSNFSLVLCTVFSCSFWDQHLSSVFMAAHMIIHTCVSKVKVCQHVAY